MQCTYQYMAYTVCMGRGLMWAAHLRSAIVPYTLLDTCTAACFQSSVFPTEHPQKKPQKKVQARHYRLPIQAYGFGAGLFKSPQHIRLVPTASGIAFACSFACYDFSLSLVAIQPVVSIHALGFTLL